MPEINHGILFWWSRNSGASIKNGDFRVEGNKPAMEKCKELSFR